MRLLLFLCLTSIAGAAPAHLAGRVLDAETGRPMPCTVAIGSKDGFRSSGEFEKDMPAGRTEITVRRGFDYSSEKRILELREGQRQRVEFRLARRTPLHRLGWYCGDSHIHMVHGEREILVSFEDIALAGRAEALDYLSVAQQWNLPHVTADALREACERASTPDLRMFWNLEAPKNYWRGDAGKCVGHGWTLGMREHAADGRDAVQELLAMSAADYESEKPPTPNFEIQAFIHELGGIVSYTHPHRWWRGTWGGKGIYPLEKDRFTSNMAAELPFDTVAGPTYDMLDISMQPDERVTHREAVGLWWMLLNHGYRMPATASSDSTFDRPGGGVPGRVRVYTQVDGEPTATALASAMRAGRNFITTGPLLLLDIDGQAPGAWLRPGKHEARLRAWPAPGGRLASVELIRNGTLVHSWQPEAGEFRASLSVEEAGAAWYIARCTGADDLEYAITNAIYCVLPGQKAPQPAQAHVRGTVREAKSGVPLSGRLEVILMDGRKPVVHSEIPFAGGSFDVRVPPTARLRTRIDGYAPEMKSVFTDFSPLLNSMLNLRAEQLSDWRTYERVRALLEQVQLNFSPRSLR